MKANTSYASTTRECNSVRGSRASTAPWNANSNYSKNVHGLEINKNLAAIIHFEDSVYSARSKISPREINTARTN
jgi:hypothetical protein